ncbi:DNA alkylation repair protein [Candidatus Bipolaricaulota bacterium]|nr:DNA alkylation repair protein [Candidatus Bipolaricaulota bacterium]
MDNDILRNSLRQAITAAGSANGLANEIRSICRRLGTPENIKGAARFIPGIGESFGVQLPALRIMASELLKEFKQDDERLIALVECLWENASREERVIAAKMLERMGKRMPERVVELVRKFSPSLRNWEECDQLGAFGLRYVVQRRPELVFAQCEQWQLDPQLWIRRLAVVNLTSLPKAKDYEPSSRELALLDVAMQDNAREVQDGIIWALREMAKRHPAIVKRFLLRYVTTSHRGVKRVLRQASKSLPLEMQQSLGDRLVS